MRGERREEIGFQVRTLSNLIKRLVDQAVFTGEDAAFTGMHGWIVGYLYGHREQDIFQRDIQEQFAIRRSTVTGILQLMEKNGLITRQSVEEDARLKKITLTPKAIEQHERIHQGIAQVEARVARDLTPDEKGQFLALCEKIRRSLEE